MADAADVGHTASGGDGVVPGGVDLDGLDPDGLDPDGLDPDGFDPDGMDNRDPGLIDAFCRFAHDGLNRWFDAEVRGLERIPEGKALYVANHNGGMATPDTWVIFGQIYARWGLEGLPYGLGHDLPMRIPGVGKVLGRLGGVRASHDNARRLFERGRKVLVYPGGDVEAMRAWRDRDRILFDGRRGYVRLALRHGVPVLPVVAAGAHEGVMILDDGRWIARAIGANRWARMKVFPIALSVPFGLTIGPLLPHLPLPTRILSEILEPITFERSGETAASDDDYVAECAHRIESAMQEALTRLAKERSCGRGSMLGDSALGRFLSRR